VRVINTGFGDWLVEVVKMSAEAIVFRSHDDVAIVYSCELASKYHAWPRDAKTMQGWMRRVFDASDSWIRRLST
jgi:hypothetical protein